MFAHAAGGEQRCQVLGFWPLNIHQPQPARLSQAALTLAPVSPAEPKIKRDDLTTHTL